MKRSRFYRFDAVMFSLLTLTGMVTFGNISFARKGVNNTQSKCFNNLLNSLPNASFKASSVWRNRVEFEAQQARMSKMIDTTSKHHGNAWCSNGEVSSKESEWLEIDLGRLQLINYFITMGRGEGNFKEFMSSFYFEYQREVGQWIRYKDIYKNELLTANSDSRNVAQTQFESLIVAKKIRILPISRNVPLRVCLKLAVYGCSFDDGVVEYSIPQGHYFTMDQNEKYNFEDQTYDGSNRTDSAILFGGLGQLMDDKIYQGTIPNGSKDGSALFPFVGWNRKMMKSNEVEITMKLDQVRRMKEIKLYTLNMIPKEIGFFASARIHFSMGGVTYDAVTASQYYETSVDRRVYHSRWIDIPLRGQLTRFVKLTLAFDLEWIVLSEIILISEISDANIEIEQPIGAVEDRNISTKKEIFHPASKTAISTETSDKIPEVSFSKNSNFGFLATLISGFLGFLLLLSLIVFGIISIIRRHRRIKGKLRYPSYSARMNGGPFIGDSLVVPLTGGTHSSSSTGNIYYKHPGSVDLGLSYPITGKEYMTLSSKSGTDYDMAGSNSLDGLLPTSKDVKFIGSGSHFPQNHFNDNQYPVQAYTRHSNDGSLGSSYTEYATTSLYHFPQSMENSTNISQHGFANNNFQLQPLNSNVPTPSSYKVQSPTPSMQMFGPNHISDMFPQYSPYRHISYLNHYSPKHNFPSRFLTPTNFDMYSIPYLIPENNIPLPSALRGNVLPPLEGIFGNSIMISTDNNFLQPISTVSLTNILTNLKEIGQDEIEHISIIGRGENGSIGYIRTLPNNIPEGSSIPQPKTYLSKSLSNYVSKDIRNEVVRELTILARIKHPAFMKLSSYAFDHQNSMSIKQLTLCFLFEIDEQMENLYTMLQQNSTTNSGALNLPRGPILYSQSNSNLSKTSNVDSRNLYPSVSSLLYICYQIAKGMDYLEIRSIVHRDLAARNCLVNQNLDLKITDIAMSIQKFKEHYIECTTMQIQMNEESQTSSALSVVKQNYPLQWMAFETILQGTYTAKTDVWSFGVTMWEIVTRCEKPPFGAFGITIDRIIENANYLSSGSQDSTLPNEVLHRQHLKPQGQYINSQTIKDFICPIFDPCLGLGADFSDLIRECWHKNPSQRPSFESISSFLEQKISHLQMESLSLRS